MTFSSSSLLEAHKVNKPDIQRVRQNQEARQNDKHDSLQNCEQQKRTKFCQEKETTTTLCY